MWGQTTAGVIGGLPLAFFLAAVFAALLPTDLLTKLAVAGVAALPLWACIISAAFATPSASRAWGWVIAANLASALALYALSAAGLYGVPAGMLQ